MGVTVGACGLVVALTLGASASGMFDFGLFVQHQLARRSDSVFGVSGTLKHSSRASISEQEAQGDPARLAEVADSLQIDVVTAGRAGASIDMMALWPNDVNPRWLLACNEEDPGLPGVQRINIKTGAIATIVTGTDSCDGVRRTPWHTFMFSEEAGGGPEGGRVYELIDPLHTTDVVLDRVTGQFSGGHGAENLVVRPALGRLSYEGFALYRNGVMYYGDEKRPFEGEQGGSYFKFVPSSPYRPSDGPISSLDESPWTEGSVYGLRLGIYEEPDYGQGTQQGFGEWIPVCDGEGCADADLTTLAVEQSATGYYRPEDIDIDRAAEHDGRVRFCGNDTGNEDGDQYYGETICITDGTLGQATANEAIPEAQLLVVGNPELAMPDNIAYQPHRGNWIIHEDAATEYLRPHNNDLWDCRDDGQDDNLLSDGCVRVATLNDLTAEWSGGVFDAWGKHFYVSVQHNISGAGVVLDITGWK